MRHTGGLLRRAVSMVVQFKTYVLEARFWTAKEARIPEVCRVNFGARVKLDQCLFLQLLDDREWGEDNLS